MLIRLLAVTCFILSIGANTSHAAIVLNSGALVYQDGSSVAVTFDGTTVFEEGVYDLTLPPSVLTSFEIISGLNGPLFPGKVFSPLLSLQVFADDSVDLTFSFFFDDQWFFESHTVYLGDALLVIQRLCGSNVCNVSSERLDFAVVAPVPIPAAAWLFGSALLGLFGAARRKKVRA